jgi:hypothetical protein
VTSSSVGVAICVWAVTASTASSKLKSRSYSWFVPLRDSSSVEPTTALRYGLLMLILSL